MQEDHGCPSARLRVLGDDNSPTELAARKVVDTSPDSDLLLDRFQMLKIEIHV